MERKYPHLCQPITLGNVTFRNRMFASPIGATDIDKDCVPGERTRAFYELRAKGGAAAVTMSELVVHPETDGSHMLHLDLATVGSLAAFTFTADAIKRHGAVPSVEFSHSGQYAGTYMADKNKKQGLTQYGPSDGVRPDGMNVYLAEEIKKHVKKPVATIGGLNDPEQMEEIIASGKADVVYMGRALLADPYLPQKVVSGNDDKIVKCLRCFTCMAERPTTQTRRCTVNPLIGREIEGTDIVPAAVKKNVLVVGGGVAGLKAAVTAALRGHKVVLCEKSDKVGGILKCEQAIDFKQEMYQLGLSLEAQAIEAGVEIRCNTEVTPEYAEAQNADVMILAVGSNPIVPPLKGIDGDNVVIVNNYYLEKEKVGDSVVVLGGGLAGCEAAIHLAQEGKKVHLVEMRPELAPDANIRHRPILMQMVDKYVEAHTGYQGMEVTADGVLCKDADGNEVLVPGKSVICAVGQRANRDGVNALRNCAPVVREIGDCVRPSNITSAIYMGYHAGLDA